MTEDEYLQFKCIDHALTRSRAVCDPIQFFHRKIDLLEQLADHLLQPYYEEVARRSKEEQDED